jgi:N-formylglutamate deformylase
MTVVLHIPHASTHIPPEIRDQFLLSDAELEAEIQAMTDHRTDELFAGLGGMVVAAEVSRLVCDVERFLDDPMEAVVWVPSTPVRATRSRYGGC